MSSHSFQVNVQATAALPDVPRVETAGDPNRPASFLSVKEDEFKLAAYLGFSNCTQLRQFCLSWPVITAFLEFEVFADHVRQSSLLQLALELKDDEQAIVTMSCEDYPAYIRNVLSCTGRKYNFQTLWALWIVLRLESDLEVYTNTDDASNIAENEVALKDLSNSLARPVPTRSLGLPVPSLGPFPGEHRLESINRCYTLLRWLTYVHQRREERRIWNSKFGSEGAVLGGRKVRPAKIPDWMRPMPQGSQGTNTA